MISNHLVFQKQVRVKVHSLNIWVFLNLRMMFSNIFKYYHLRKFSMLLINLLVTLLLKNYYCVLLYFLSKNRFDGTV